MILYNNKSRNAIKTPPPGFNSPFGYFVYLYLEFLLNWTNEIHSYLI